MIHRNRFDAHVVQRVELKTVAVIFFLQFDVGHGGELRLQGGFRQDAFRSVGEKLGVSGAIARPRASGVSAPAPATYGFILAALIPLGSAR